MKRYIIIISLVVSAFNCSWMQKIEREIKPVEKYDIAIDEKECAIFKDESISVSLEVIYDSHWEYLSNFDLFLNENSKSSIWRAPKLLFFHLVALNTGEHPVKIDGIKIKYNKIENEALSIKKVKEKCKSPIYSPFNFNTLLSYKRILSDKYRLNEIDFENNAINYKFDFINSGDKISGIIAFDWIPVEIRRFILELQIKYLDRKKNIEFIFNRLEYRDRGHFSKPSIDELEE